MIYLLPEPEAESLVVLDVLRDELIARSGVGGPVIRRLRRQARTTAFSASTTIEGFGVPPDVEALANRDHSDTTDPDRAALSCYALAMQHVGVLAQDPTFLWVDRVVLDLHFEACSFQRARRPGLWRSGPVFVTRPDGQKPYEAPSAAEVPGLVAELISWLSEGDLDAHPAVRAAMAHLHLVSIHPFEDGNGRLARIVQSLVLARSGPLPPELGSIEPTLAKRTPDYYAELTRVQGNQYDASRDASSWVDFCIAAHCAEARSRLAQLADATRRWELLEALVSERGWPDRLTIAMEQAVFGGCTRATYRGEAEVSTATASNDLRRLVDAGWLKVEGRGRSVRYSASAALVQRLG